MVGRDRTKTTANRRHPAAGVERRKLNDGAMPRRQTKNDMSTTQIKACPFCGQQPVIEKPEPSMQMVFVKCKNHDCQSRPGTDGLGERMAIDRWNRRAGDRTPTPLETECAKGVGMSDLLAAVKLAVDEWQDIQAQTRKPISHWMKEPQNEQRIFKMVITMNNLKAKYLKAANNVISNPTTDPNRRK
jgi:hypothetical protein